MCRLAWTLIAESFLFRMNEFIAMVIHERENMRMEWLDVWYGSSFIGLRCHLARPTIPPMCSISQARSAPVGSQSHAGYHHAARITWPRFFYHLRSEDRFPSRSQVPKTI